jgi:hypothetical protein
MNGLSRLAGYLFRLGTVAALVGIFVLAVKGTRHLAAPPQAVHAQTKQPQMIHVQQNGEFGKAHELSSASVHTLLETRKSHPGKS